MKMYSDPISVRKPLRDCLGPNFDPSSRFANHPPILKRRSQGLTCWNRLLHGEKNHVVAGDGTSSKQENDVLKSSKNSTVSTREGQQKTPNVVSSTHATLAKEPAAPASEKKYIVLTIETFLQKLGLSKYLVTFKAEEIDMYALKHVNDDDLKAIGLPMGPRKKILYAIARLKAQKK